VKGMEGGGIRMNRYYMNYTWWKGKERVGKIDWKEEQRQHCYFLIIKYNNNNNNKKHLKTKKRKKRKSDLWDG
jgi:hypothetical protein